MRLLIVEVELHNCLSAQLRKAGYTVDSAADGRIGEYYGNEYPIDVAIVDLGLPDTGPSGLELIQRRRATSYQQRIWDTRIELAPAAQRANYEEHKFSDEAYFNACPRFGGSLHTIANCRPYRNTGRQYV